MVQNRNRLIAIFIGNISNAVVHEILERAVSKELMADKYRKELTASFDVAKRYREKINPANRPLPDKDIAYVRDKIVNKVRVELTTRISKGYENIDVDLVEELIDKALRDIGVV